MAQVRLERVTKQYAGAAEPVLRELDLTIEDREFLVLVGPSGCGKSTALRVVAGLESVSSGVVRIGDKEVTHLHPKHRDVAMVFQNYALYPHLTCRQNLAFALKLKGVSRAEVDRRVNETAKLLQIEALLDRKPKALSGGQRQRVAIGRAMVREPQAFLMDEPLSNLDAKLRVSMRSELKRLHQRLDSTFIYVTHDQTEAMTLGTRIAILNQGRLQQVASPHEVYHRPQNVFVATFIGSPQMNVLKATASIEGSRATVSGEGFRFELFNPPAALKPGPVLLGVRPEHLTLAPAGARMTGVLEVAEPMGFESLLHLSVGGSPVVVRHAGEVELRQGAFVGLTADAQHLHLFDASTEARL